jgi:hypothetical protein
MENPGERVEPVSAYLAWNIDGMNISIDRAKAADKVVAEVQLNS